MFLMPPLLQQRTGKRGITGNFSDTRIYHDFSVRMMTITGESFKNLYPCKPLQGSCLTFSV